MRAERFKRLKRLERFQSFKTFNPFKDERGVALVLVLWVFVFLFAVAVGFSSSVREEGMAAHRYAEETEGYYLALGGFQEGLYRLLDTAAVRTQPIRPGQGRAQAQEMVDCAWREGESGSGLYRFRLVDEGGKINLNRADEETLRRVFTHIGIDEPRRSVLADSILDWRDDDNLHRASGAESDYYLSLSPSYTARNGPFDSVEELLWVRGVTPELFYGWEEDGVRRVGLREIFTVDHPTDRINLRTACAEVIHAVVGLPLDRSRAFVEERKKLSERTLVDLLKLLGVVPGDALTRRFVFAAPTTVTVEAVGYRSDSLTQRRVRGVVRVVGGSRGFGLLRWVDRDIPIEQGNKG